MMKNTLSRYRWMLLLILLISLGLSVLLLPFPTSVKDTMHGATVTAEGKVEGTFDFTISGWYLNYLLRDDILKAEISLPEDASSRMSVETLGPLYDQLSPDHWVVTCSTYDRTENAMTFGHLALRKDRSACFLELEEGCYLVGSREDGIDPASLLEQFSFLLR